MIMSDKDLYETIHKLYGHSDGWLVDLAAELKVSIKAASQLAQEAGYRRHKLVKRVSFEEFIAEPYAKYVINKKGLNEYEKL